MWMRRPASTTSASLAATRARVRSPVYLRRVLLLLNGAPGVGKSALADRYARQHALALVVDVDELRRQLGQWETTGESKSVARALAAALAADHLARGSHVVVPQYL